MYKCTVCTYTHYTRYSEKNHKEACTDRTVNYNAIIFSWVSSSRRQKLSKQSCYFWTKSCLLWCPPISSMFTLTKIQWTDLITPWDKNRCYSYYLVPSDVLTSYNTIRCSRPPRTHFLTVVVNNEQCCSTIILNTISSNQC